MTPVLARAHELQARLKAEGRPGPWRWRVSGDLLEELEGLIVDPPDEPYRLNMLMGWDLVADTGLPPNSLIVEEAPGCAHIGIDLAAGEDRTAIVVIRQ